MMRFTILFGLFIAFSSFSFAQDAKDAFRSTNYPLPRFVSLRSSEVYARTGPGKKYPIRYVYERKGMPIEIILEYDSWRKVRDHDGDEGWIHKTLLSGRRTALVKQDGYFQRKPKESARKTVHVKKDALIAIEECNAAWCLVRAGSYQGWLPQSSLWGVYPKEIIE